MRSSRGGTALGLVVLALLVGAGAAGARPAPETPVAKLMTPALMPAGAWMKAGHHCHTRRDPVAPDPADL